MPQATWLAQKVVHPLRPQLRDSAGLSPDFAASPTSVQFEKPNQVGRDTISAPCAVKKNRASN